MTLVKFRLRRDSAANWASENPVLALGEPGLETDTARVKYGDGATAWNSLPYPPSRDRQIIVPTNGGTTNLAASAAEEIIVYLNHTSTIASHTFNLPTLDDGQRISFRSKAAITSTSLVPASGSFLGSIGSFTANGHASWEWVASTAQLWRAE